MKMSLRLLLPILLFFCVKITLAESPPIPVIPGDVDTDGSKFASSESSTEVLTPLSQVGKFWEEAQKLGPQAGHKVLDQVTKVFSSDVRNGVSEFKNTLTQVVEHAHKIRADIQAAIENKDITMEHVTDMFSREISGVYEEIKDQLEDLMAEDRGESSQNRGEKAKTRAKLVDRVLDKVQAAYIHVLTEVGVPREEAESHSKSFFSMLKRLLLILGNLVDKYPMLLEALVFAASMLLLPQISILRPILTLLGFGPLGPMRGTAAAWAQRMFFGGVIPAGSWFAILQRVGMTLAGSWVEKLAASVGLAAILGFGRGDRDEM